MKSSPQILTYYWQLNIQIYKVIYYNQDERFLEIMIGLMFEIRQVTHHISNQKTTAAGTSLGI